MKGDRSQLERQKSTPSLLVGGQRPRSKQPNWNIQAALGSVRVANGDLWIVTSGGKDTSPNGIWALNGARGLATDTPVMPHW